MCIRDRTLGKAADDFDTIWTLEETETLMYAVYDICRTDGTFTAWYTNSTKPEFEGPILQGIFEENNTTFTDNIEKNIRKKILYFLNKILQFKKKIKIPNINYMQPY